MNSGRLKCCCGQSGRSQSPSGDMVIPGVNATRQATVVSVTPANEAVGDLNLWPWAFVAVLESRSDWLFRIGDV